MEQCESKVGGICPRPATWKQIVHAGHREAGRFLLHSYWCDAHADTIIAKRRREFLPPPQMVPLSVEAPEAR
jgi:hypothetical protein